MPEFDKSKVSLYYLGSFRENRTDTSDATMIFDSNMLNLLYLISYFQTQSQNLFPQ